MSMAWSMGASVAFWISSMHSIPTEVTGLKNEVIAQKGHRYEYDRAIRNCGAKFVEVVTLADYETAFNERTVPSPDVVAGAFNRPACLKPSRRGLAQYKSQFQFCMLHLQKQ
jgi:hypothetical protein